MGERRWVRVSRDTRVEGEWGDRARGGHSLSSLKGRDAEEGGEGEEKRGGEKGSFLLSFPPPLPLPSAVSSHIDRMRVLGRKGIRYTVDRRNCRYTVGALTSIPFAAGASFIPCFSLSSLFLELLTLSRYGASSTSTLY